MEEGPIEKDELRDLLGWKGTGDTNKLKARILLRIKALWDREDCTELKTILFASLHFLSEDWEGCVTALDEVIDVVEDGENLLYVRLLYARAQYELGYPRKGIDVLDPITQKFPEDPLLYAVLTYLAFHCRHDPEIEKRAYEWAPKAFRLNPKWFKSLLGSEEFEDLRDLSDRHAREREGRQEGEDSGGNGHNKRNA